MSAASGTVRTGANSGAANLCGEQRNRLRANSAVMQKARWLFPRKTAVHLAEITGYSQRACEYWLAGKSSIPTDAIQALLHSEFGLDILSVLMAEAAPAWWRRITAYFAAIDAQRLQCAARRKLREAIDADASSDPQWRAPTPFLFTTRTFIGRTLMRSAQWLAYAIAPWLRPSAVDD